MATPESRPKPAEDIFARISDELAKGTVPWHKPWVVRPECILSYDRGKPYSLRNRMLLSFAGEYATFNQIKKLGGSVNKGAKGKWVYFSKEVKRKKEDPDEKDSFYHLLKAYCVFNICDTNLEPKWPEKWSGEKAPDCNAMQVVRDYCERTGVAIHEAGASAFYSPSSDELQVPNINTFESEVEFYSTLFHEVAHSTGKRLGRQYGVSMLGMADDKYCREELVAEITAALCLGHLGLDTEDTVINSAAYISSWQKNLSQMKPTEFGDACYQAQRAFNLIFNINESNKE